MTFYQFKLHDRVIVRPFESRTFSFAGIVLSKKLSRPNTPYEQNQYRVEVPRERGRFAPAVILNGITESEMELMP